MDINRAKQVNKMRDKPMKLDKPSHNEDHHTEEIAPIEYTSGTSDGSIFEKPLNQITNEEKKIRMKFLW
jgi:hypothetical protein